MPETSATAWLSLLCTDGSSSEGAISLLCAWAITFGLEVKENGTRSCVNNLELYDGFGGPSLFKRCVNTPPFLQELLVISGRSFDMSVSFFKKCVNTPPCLQEFLVGSGRSFDMFEASWKTKNQQMGNARGNTQFAF